MMPLETLLTSAFGLCLGMLGHIVGWPFPRGGAQQITAALVSYLRRLGAELVINASVATLGELPLARAVPLEVSGLAAMESRPETFR